MAEHQLYIDILLEVFSINASGIEPPPKHYSDIDNFQTITISKQTCLETTRISSQVCSLWRDLILTSPSLWGACLDLDELDRARSYLWAEEVFRRTGSRSMLSVKATAHMGYTPQLRSLLSVIVNQHWTRIQSFEVHVNALSAWRQDYKSPRIRVDNEIQAALFTAAPHLISLKVYIQNWGITPDRSGFLGNEAPMLRIVDWTSDNPYDENIPQTSAFAHLTRLSLSSQVSLLEILTSLKKIPHLETLFVKKFEMAHSLSTYPQVHLTNLRHLQVSHGALGCVSLVDHIERPKGCFIEVKIIRDIGWRPMNLSREDVLNVLQRGYDTYIKQYLVTQSSESSLSILVGLTSFSLHLNDPRRNAHQRTSGPLFWFASGDGTRLLDVFRNIIERIPFPVLVSQYSKPTEVTYLYLDIPFKFTKKLITDLPTTFRLLLFGLSASLTRLAINIPTLKFFLSTSQSDSELLPKLSFLEIISKDYWGKLDPLYLFLDWRANIRYPIEVLDMSRFSPWVFDNEDTSYWDTLSFSMKLIYQEYPTQRILQYMCGKGLGKPAMLVDL